MPSRRTLAVLTLVVAVCSSAGTVLAQNQVVNGDFTTYVSNWLNGTPTISWSPLDAFGNPGSGSGLVTLPIVGGAGTYGCHQVINTVVVGSTYDYGGRIFVPSGQTAGITIRITALFYGAGCGGIISSASTTGVLTSGGSTDTWVFQTGSIVAPVGATCARVFLELSVPAATGNPVTANFDTIRFGLQPTTPVELKSVNVD